MDKKDEQSAHLIVRSDVDAHFPTSSSTSPGSSPEQEDGEVLPLPPSLQGGAEPTIHLREELGDEARNEYFEAPSIPGQLNFIYYQVCVQELPTHLSISFHGNHVATIRLE
jgi:hypothetical protein